MPTPAGQLVDKVLRRTRDPAGLATTRAFVREMLTQAQRFVNLASPGVLDVATMPTFRRRVLYDFPIVGLTRNGEAVDPNEVARVDAIRDDAGKDLVRVDWHSFARVDREWIRRTSTTSRFWARMGRDILALYPARDVDSSVTLVYTKLTKDLSSDDVTTEVREDREPAVLALAEVLLLTHRRLYAAAQTAMTRLERELARLPVAGGAGQASFFGAGGPVVP